MNLKRVNTLSANKDVASVFIITGVILALPLIAMQFTSEVDWSLFDFVLMGSLLIATGMLIVTPLRKVKDFRYRLAAIATAVLVFLLIWAELAVGIFGTPFAGS